MKQANVCVYTTLMIRINGIEGETNEAIIQESLDTLHREEIDKRINTVLVDPLSPTARNLMGEFVHWQLDLDGVNTYLVAENEYEDTESVMPYEDHPLLMEPRPFTAGGDKPSEAAFKLLKRLSDLDEANASDELKDIIAQAKALSE